MIEKTRSALMRIQMRSALMRIAELGTDDPDGVKCTWRDLVIEARRIAKEALAKEAESRNERKCRHETELTHSDNDYRYLKCVKCGDEWKYVRHLYSFYQSSSSAQETSAASAESNAPISSS